MSMDANNGSGKGPPTPFSNGVNLETASSGVGGAPHVRRLKTLKRKKEEKESSRNQVKLDRVLGLTVTSNASLATAPSSGMHMVQQMIFTHPPTWPNNIQFIYIKL